MVDVAVPLIFAFIVGVVEYLSKSLSLHHKKYYHKVVSFSAGVSSTYVLLELFPFFAEKALQIDRILFIALLGGFISHHIAEKEIYKHNQKHDLIKMLSLEENIFYYIYHVIIGLLLVAFMQQDKVEGVIFFVSIVAYTMVSNLPAQPHKSDIRMVLLSTSTFIGAALGVFVIEFIPKWLEYSLVGLITGVLIFTITRHHIPFGRKGKTSFFALGFVVYAILIISKWYIF